MGESLNDNLQQQAQALFKSWFIDFDPFSGKKTQEWTTMTLDTLTSLICCGITPKYCDKSKEIESLHIGSTGQTELPRERVKAIKLLLSDEDSMNKFNSIIHPITMAIVANQRENKKLAIIRDTLLPKLIAGEIDVTIAQP